MPPTAGRLVRSAESEREIMSWFGVIVRTPMLQLKTVFFFLFLNIRYVTATEGQQSGQGANDNDKSTTYSHPFICSDLFLQQLKLGPCWILVQVHVVLISGDCIISTLAILECPRTLSSQPNESIKSICLPLSGNMPTPLLKFCSLCVQS